MPENGHFKCNLALMRLDQQHSDSDVPLAAADRSLWLANESSKRYVKPETHRLSQ